MLKALDLFCCAGGASYGIAKNGFAVTGIDIAPQPHYPFEFVQMDVHGINASYLAEFDYIWASPPCQPFTQSTKQWRAGGKEYPDLIALTRDLLVQSGKPYTLENVPGAPLVDPIMLCGSMFGMNMYRHRLFESNFKVLQPVHESHKTKNVKMGRPPTDKGFIQMVGHFSGVPKAREITGHTWMNQYELAQCIPWKYSEYISKYHPMIGADL